MKESRSFLPSEIHALTMIVTPSNFTKVDKDMVPSISSLRVTSRDASQVDRIVFIDANGNRTFIKNRYPADRLPNVTIIDHEFVRPTHIPYDSIEAWCGKVMDMRHQLQIHRQFD